MSFPPPPFIPVAVAAAPQPSLTHPPKLRRPSHFRAGRPAGPRCARFRRRIQNRLDFAGGRERLTTGRAFLSACCSAPPPPACLSLLRGGGGASVVWCGVLCSRSALRGREGTNGRSAVGWVGERFGFVPAFAHLFSPSVRGGVLLLHACALRLNAEEYLFRRGPGRFAADAGGSTHSREWFGLAASSIHVINWTREGVTGRVWFLF